MSDEQATAAEPLHVQLAEALVADERTTFSTVLSHGPLVLHHVAEQYPQRLAMLREAHARWVQNGRPASSPPTVPVLPEPSRPAPAPEPSVAVPDSTSVSSMRDLVNAGPRAMAAFKSSNPQRYAELAAAAGVPVSRP